VLALAAASLSAQTDVPIQNLSLVAFDAHGQPVNDLKADEIVVTDAGKSRKVAFLRRIERGRSKIPHATVILLDLMNQSFSTRGVAANQLVRTLQSLESPDYLYVYLLTLEGKLYPVRGLPGSEGAAEAEDGSAWTKNSKTLLDGALRAVMRTRPVDIDVAVRTQLTYRALENLGGLMAEVPGRKNLVWITDGVPISLGPRRSDTGDVVDFTPLLRQLSLALDRSEIAIYPVPQIMVGSTDGPSDYPGAGPPSAASGEQSVETLNEFAGLTGGRPDSGKDVGAAVTQAMNDARSSYQMGYYAPGETWDNRFHKLRVTCARKGVKIQAKTGYYAWPEDPQEVLTQALRTAIQQPVDAAEIGIRGGLADGGKKLSVVVDAKDIVLLHEGDKYTGELSFVLAGYAADGKAQTSPVRSLNLSFTAAERDKALAEGIAYTVDAPADANVTVLRFVAFDGISHGTGSVTIRLK
jgi:VWFA-related protein